MRSGVTRARANLHDRGARPLLVRNTGTRACVINRRQPGNIASQSSGAFIILAHFADSSMKANQPEYVPGLDLLRFGAAFAVMLYHLAFWSWAFPAGQVALASKHLA